MTYPSKLALTWTVFCFSALGESYESYEEANVMNLQGLHNFHRKYRGYTQN